VQALIQPEGHHPAESFSVAVHQKTPALGASFHRPVEQPFRFARVARHANPHTFLIALEGDLVTGDNFPLDTQLRALDDGFGACTPRPVPCPTFNCCLQRCRLFLCVVKGESQRKQLS
jgi:hypothetical protein